METTRRKEHLFNPDTIHLTTFYQKNNYVLYKQYADKINNQAEKAITLRSLLDFDFAKATPIPIEEVEAD